MGGSTGRSREKERDNRTETGPVWCIATEEEEEEEEEEAAGKAGKAAKAAAVVKALQYGTPTPVPPGGSTVRLAQVVR